MPFPQNVQKQYQCLIKASAYYLITTKITRREGQDLMYRCNKERLDLNCTLLLRCFLQFRRNTVESAKVTTLARDVKNF